MGSSATVGGAVVGRRVGGTSVGVGGFVAGNLVTVGAAVAVEFRPVLVLAVISGVAVAGKAVGSTLGAVAVITTAVGTSVAAVVAVAMGAIGVSSG